MDPSASDRNAGARKLVALANFLHQQKQQERARLEEATAAWEADQRAKQLAIIEKERKMHGRRDWDQRHLGHVEEGELGVCVVCLAIALEIERDREVAELMLLSRKLYVAADDSESSEEEFFDPQDNIDLVVSLLASLPTTYKEVYSRSSAQDTPTPSTPADTSTTLEESTTKHSSPATTTSPASKQPATPTPTPLEVLTTWLQTLFAHTDRESRLETASMIWEKIYDAVEFDGSSVIVDAQGPIAHLGTRWDDWAEMMSLILVLTAKKEEMWELMSWVRTHLSVDEIEELRKEEKAAAGKGSTVEQDNVADGSSPGDDGEVIQPRLNLRQAWDLAVSESLEGRTTIIAVKLIDIEHARTMDQGKKEPFKKSSFGHGFVLGVGPEGCRLYQVWGYENIELEEHEKPTDLYLDLHVLTGCAGLRPLSDGENMVGIVERFTSAKGTAWNGKRNRYYLQAFGFDMKLICGEGKTRNALYDNIDAWLNIRIVKDVKAEDIWKFQFVNLAEQKSYETEETEKDGGDTGVAGLGISNVFDAGEEYIRDAGDKVADESDSDATLTGDVI